jgi:hypothetical protein
MGLKEMYETYGDLLIGKEFKFKDPFDWVDDLHGWILIRGMGRYRNDPMLLVTSMMSGRETELYLSDSKEVMLNESNYDYIRFQVKVRLTRKFMSK